MRLVFAAIAALALLSCKREADHGLPIVYQYMNTPSVALWFEPDMTRWEFHGGGEDWNYDDGTFNLIDCSTHEIRCVASDGQTDFVLALPRDLPETSRWEVHGWAFWIPEHANRHPVSTRRIFIQYARIDNPQEERGSLVYEPGVGIVAIGRANGDTASLVGARGVWPELD